MQDKMTAPTRSEMPSITGISGLFQIEMPLWQNLTIGMSFDLAETVITFKNQ